MELKKFIREEEYQKIKNILNKEDDFYTKEELIILMQFLMQRQRKVVKNELKI